MRWLGAGGKALDAVANDVRQAAIEQVCLERALTSSIVAVKLEKHGPMALPEPLTTRFLEGALLAKKKPGNDTSADFMVRESIGKTWSLTPEVRECLQTFAQRCSIRLKEMQGMQPDVAPGKFRS